MKLEDEEYNVALEKYLEDGINYQANTVARADKGDLEQLAADSFWYGAKHILERLEKSESEGKGMTKERIKESKGISPDALNLVKWYIGHSISLYNSIDDTNKKHVNDLTEEFNRRWKILHEQNKATLNLTDAETIEIALRGFDAIVDYYEENAEHINVGMKLQNMCGMAKRTAEAIRKHNITNQKK